LDIFCPSTPGQPGRGGQNRFRLDQDHAARAFQVSEHPLAVTEREVLRVGQQGAALLQRLVVALLLVTRAQFQVALAAPDPELLDGSQGLFLEAGLARPNR